MENQATDPSVRAEASSKLSVLERLLALSTDTLSVTERLVQKGS